MLYFLRPIIVTFRSTLLFKFQTLIHEIQRRVHTPMCTLFSMRLPCLKKNKPCGFCKTPNIVLKMDSMLQALLRSSLLFSLPSSLRIPPALFPSLQRVCPLQLSPAQVVTAGLWGIHAKGVTLPILTLQIISMHLYIHTNAHWAKLKLCFMSHLLFSVPVMQTDRRRVYPTHRLFMMCSSLSCLVLERQVLYFVFVFCYFLSVLVSLLPRLASAEVC